MLSLALKFVTIGISREQSLEKNSEIYNIVHRFIKKKRRVGCNNFVDSRGWS